jgi:hypothetical protein
MNDDLRDLEALRDAARELRHEPDAAMLARVRAGVRDRIAEEPSSPWDILAGWLRPAAVSFATIMLIVAAAWMFAPESFAPEEMADTAQRIVISREAARALP